jgi:hypothetical protein
VGWRSKPLKYARGTRPGQARGPGSGG